MSCTSRPWTLLHFLGPPGFCVCPQPRSVHSASSCPNTTQPFSFASGENGDFPPAPQGSPWGSARTGVAAWTPVPTLTSSRWRIGESEPKSLCLAVTVLQDRAGRRAQAESPQGVSSGPGGRAGAMTRRLHQAPGHHLGQTLCSSDLCSSQRHTFPSSCAPLPHHIPFIPGLCCSAHRTIPTAEASTPLT